MAGVNGLRAPAAALKAGVWVRLSEWLRTAFDSVFRQGETAIQLVQDVQRSDDQDRLSFRKPCPPFPGASSMTAATEEENGILLRLADGDAGAAQEVINAYGGLVWSLALRFCRSRADAEDAVQEILTDVWKSAHRYRSARASERVFISMIARRRLIDRLRRDKRRGEVEPMAAGPSSELQHPGDSGERGWDAQQAAQAMQSLSDDQRQVLEMSVAQGLTQREIAEATGTPLGTVKTHMRRGLIRLRELMSDDQDVGKSGGASS